MDTPLMPIPPRLFKRREPIKIWSAYLPMRHKRNLRLFSEAYVFDSSLLQGFTKQFKNILPSSIMQSLEAKINILEKFILEIQTMNTALIENEPTTELFQTKLSEIVNQFEALDSDSDYDSDTDSDISFTEEEREHIESEEHCAFLKRYSLKPSAEIRFVPK